MVTVFLREDGRLAESRFDYRLSPEPGPVGVSVDPLGEAPAPRVLPDGFLTLAEPVAEPDVAPVPTRPVVLAEPVVVPVAGLLTPAPTDAPPDVLLLCANANVLDSANAVARAMVWSFMELPSGFDDGITTRRRRLMFRRIKSS